MNDKLIEWRKSELKRIMEDGQWRHFAVMVNSTHVVFGHQGVMEEPVRISRPITDCKDGVMSIGSKTLKGNMVDMKYFPRVLSETDLSDVKNGGKTLDDLLASSGAQLAEDSEIEKLDLKVESNFNKEQSQRTSMLTGITSTFRRQVFGAISNHKRYSSRYAGISSATTATLSVFHV